MPKLARLAPRAANLPPLRAGRLGSSRHAVTGVESEIEIEICPQCLDLGLGVGQRPRVSIIAPEFGAAGAIGRQLPVFFFVSVGPGRSALSGETRIGLFDDSDGAVRDALRRLLFVGFSMGLVKEGADMEGTLEIGMGESLNTSRLVSPYALVLCAKQWLCCAIACCVG